MVRLAAIGVAALSMPSNLKELGYDALAVIEAGDTENSIRGKDYASVIKVEPSEDRSKVINELTSKFDSQRIDVCVLSVDEVLGSAFLAALTKKGGVCGHIIAGVDFGSRVHAALQVAALKEISLIAAEKGSKVILERKELLLKRKIAMVSTHYAILNGDRLPAFSTLLIKRVKDISRYVPLLNKAREALSTASKYYDYLTLDGKNYVDMLKKLASNLDSFFKKGTDLTVAVKTPSDLLNKLREVVSSKDLVPLVSKGIIAPGGDKATVFMNEKTINSIGEATSSLGADIVEAAYLDDMEAIVISHRELVPLEHTFLLNMVNSEIKEMIAIYEKEKVGIHPDYTLSIPWDRSPIAGFRAEHVNDLERLLIRIINIIEELNKPVEVEDLEQQKRMILMLKELNDYINSIDIKYLNPKLELIGKITREHISLSEELIERGASTINKILENKDRILYNIAELRISAMDNKELIAKENAEALKFILRLTPYLIIKQIEYLRSAFSQK